MASVWAAGVVVKNIVGSNQSHPRVRIKPFKDQVSTSGNLTAPIAYPVNIPVGTPQYGLNSLYVDYPDLAIDALSTGNGVIPSPDANGIPVVSGWMAITASVANDATTLPSGSHFANGLAQRGGPGSEMVSYYMSGSTGINSELTGTQTMEMNADHMGVDPTDPGLDQDIIAFDYGLGLYTQGLNRPGSPLFPNNDRVYFSVTKGFADDFATNHPGETFAKMSDSVGNLTLNVVPHAADIYMMTWNDNTNTWNDITVYATAAMLGFGVNGDLDALDVDSRIDTVVYSGTAASIVESAALESQLTIIDFDGVNWTEYIVQSSANLNKSPLVLRDGPVASPQPVVKYIGGGDLDGGTENEIDSVCTTDPHVATDDSYDLGIPRGHNAVYGNPMGMSMVRTQDYTGPKRLALGTEQWCVNVTGWGDLAPHNSSLYLVRYDGTGDLAQSIADLALLTDWQVVKSRSRNLQRDSVRFTYLHPDTGIGSQEQVRLAVVQIHGTTGQRTATMVSTFIE